MSAKHKVRLHYKDGQVIVEPIARFALANNCASLADARALLRSWVRAGDLVERPDGGYNVIRFRPRQAAP